MLGGLGGEGHQRVETTIARSFKQYASCCLVLDEKKERMKLNEHMIIKSKTMN
jgi:hypothetical protein